MCAAGSDDGFLIVFNENGESIMGEDGRLSKKPVYQTPVSEPPRKSIVRVVFQLVFVAFR